jgi:hypothetical protein
MLEDDLLARIHSSFLEIETFDPKDIPLIMMYSIQEVVKLKISENYKKIEEDFTFHHREATLEKLII